MLITLEQQITTPASVVLSTPEQRPQVIQELMAVVEESPTSTDSNRSAKPEHHTASFANQFLSATYFALEKHLTQKAWFKHPRRLGLLYYP